MKIVLALLSIVVALVNLATPYVTFPNEYRIGANAVLLLAGLFLLFRGRKQRREDDVQAPHLLSLRTANEKHAAELAAVEAKLKQTESDLALARRREAEMARVKAPATGAEAQVVGLVSMLQSKGRLLDFLMDDITSYDDAQVGSAARVVHQGCREVLSEYFDIAPVRADVPEGGSVTLENGFDPKQVRLVGKVGGSPPYQGTVLHRGWITTKVKLPRLAAGAEAHHEREVLQPAEIELT